MGDKRERKPTNVRNKGVKSFFFKKNSFSGNKITAFAYYIV